VNPGETFLVILIKAVVVVFVVITGFAYTLLWERKLIGRFQARYGPNRAGPVGYLQPLADVVKLIFKEDFVPRGANKLLFQIAPMISVFAAVAAIAVIPFGGHVEIFGHNVNLYGTDLDIGVLFLFALSGLGFYGLILGGWASGNKYSLLGAARTAAQLVSYEVAMGLSIIGVIMISQSLSLVTIVERQADTVWYVLFQPIGFVIFVIAAVAETNRAPFDLPEAESELVAGYHTEYGGLKFAMFFLAEYINMIIVSALGATLFLGGYSGPFLWGWVWLVIKIVALLFLFIWLRATLPRLRYDRLMKLGWKVLLPIATANLVVTAIVVGLGFTN
jgi:NADH-quinone oxidoreductase subunit H